MIGIIGYGVVGRAIEGTFSNFFDIVKYDKYTKYDDFKSLLRCDYIFISVPTPFDCNSNKVDQSAIIESLSNLEKMCYNNIVIIKSTVPPGSCKTYSSNYKMPIVFNPEFLRESQNPNKDFENQETVVIGSESVKIFESVKTIYQKVAIKNARYYHTTFTEAEMIKCAQNTMLASRVALANMIYDACQEYNIDYDKLREIAFDRFEILGPHMVQVPGPDGERGFGGKCLPKDIRAFSMVHESALLQEIIEYNDSLRSDLDKSLINFKS